MNFDLASNSNKMIILVVAGIALLLALNVYQKQIGKNVASMLCVVVIIIVGYFGYRLLNEDEDEDNELNNLLNVDLPDNMGNTLNNSIPNGNESAHIEHFQSNNENDEDNNSLDATNKVNVTNNENAPSISENDTETQNNNSVTNGNTLNSQGLLPEGDTLFSNVNPSNNGGVINASLLNAGHHIGVNTQGCSLRNANRGLRSEPPNPQTQVSPWSQTTICPDVYRKPLE